MKKITAIGIVLLSGLISCPAIITEAVENNKISVDTQSHSKEIQPNYYLENVFSDLDDTDKVLEMPNGGFLHGEAIVTDSDGSRIYYNSNTDSNSKTVFETKSLLKELATTEALKYE